MIHRAASPEVPRNRPNERGSENAPKTMQELKQVQENVNAYQKLRQVVLQEKYPIVNATEENLQSTAMTINRRNPQAGQAAPDFYQAA